jgi:hypothetical protein
MSILDEDLPLDYELVDFNFNGSHSLDIHLSEENHEMKSELQSQSSDLKDMMQYHEPPSNRFLELDDYENSDISSPNKKRKRDEEMIYRVEKNIYPDHEMVDQPAIKKSRIDIEPKTKITGPLNDSQNSTIINSSMMNHINGSNTMNHMNGTNPMSPNQNPKSIPSPIPQPKIGTPGTLRNSMNINNSQNIPNHPNTASSPNYHPNNYTYQMDKDRGKLNVSSNIPSNITSNMPPNRLGIYNNKEKITSYGGVDYSSPRNPYPPQSSYSSQNNYNPIYNAPRAPYLGPRKEDDNINYHVIQIVKEKVEENEKLLKLLIFNQRESKLSANKDIMIRFRSNIFKSLQDLEKLPPNFGTGKLDPIIDYNNF